MHFFQHILFTLVGHIPSKKKSAVPFYCFIEMFGKSNYTEKTTKCNLGQFRKQRASKQKKCKFFFKKSWGHE